MRVLCLNPYLPPPLGGIEKEMLALASELVKLGHEVSLLTTTARFPGGESPAPPGWLPPGIRARRLRGYLRTTLSGFAPARAPLVVPGLGRAAAEAGAELVLVFNAGWGPALRPVLRRLAGRAPVLYRTYFHPPGGRLRAGKRRYILGTIALADRAVAATAGERAELIAGDALEPARVAVIPPGVHVHAPDPERVERLRRAHRLEGKQVVAHVGRLGRFKGTGHLIEVLPEVRRDTGRDVVLLLVGHESEPGVVAELAARHGVAEHVRLAGEVTDDRELRALLAAAQVFALPSAYEAFGIAYLEALAEGVPCVGCDVGGVREAIGEGGLLVREFGDLRGLREALVRLVADDGLGRELGEAGRKRVLGSLTWRHTAARLLELGAEARLEREKRLERERLP